MFTVNLFKEHLLFMRKGLTELVFIIDCSGSMYELESDTIGGFNSVIDKQRNVESEVLVSTVVFSDTSSVLHDRANIKEVKPLTREEYVTGGSTALLDAVGDAIHHIANIHKYAREEDRPEKTLFFITTDGLENASSRYSYDKIKTMISFEKEKHGWEFVFMGANIDAFDVASKMGISRERTINAINDEEGIKRNYNLMSNMVGCYTTMRREKFCEEADNLCCEENIFNEIRKIKRMRAAKH